MAIIGREQIELEVLPRLMPHMLAIDDYTEREVPGRERQAGLKAAHVVGDAVPAGSGGHQGFELHPVGDGAVQMVLLVKRFQHRRA